MFAHLQRWLRRALDWLHGRESPYRIARVADRPRRLAAKTVYVVGTAAYPWCAVFICPCGCGAEVALNLLAEARPRWFVKTLADQTVSISPSVHRTTGCASHFFLRRGEIQWCEAHRASAS